MIDHSAFAGIFRHIVYMNLYIMALKFFFFTFRLLQKNRFLNKIVHNNIVKFPVLIPLHTFVLFPLIPELRGDATVIALAVIVVLLLVLTIANYVEELWFFFRVHPHGPNRKYVIFILTLFPVPPFSLEIVLFYILVCPFYSCSLTNRRELSVAVKNVDTTHVIYFRD